MGLTELEDKLLISRLPHFDIPLILRKSDGGYGYDSTDMAAIRYRLRDLDRDWLVYITDAGQAGHFHKVFDVARAAGWTANKNQRLDHIGFGVVCGEDGKRFKTKSGDTVKLMDLLNEARDRMVTSLQQRAAEGKTDLTVSLFFFYYILEILLLYIKNNDNNVHNNNVNNGKEIKMQ